MTGQPPPCLWSDQDCYWSDADGWCPCYDDDPEADAPVGRLIETVPTGEYL